MLIPKDIVFRDFFCHFYIIMEILNKFSEVSKLYCFNNCAEYL